MPLKLGCAASDPVKASTDLLALGVFGGEAKPEPSASVGALDHSLGGALSQLMQQRGFTGKKDQKLVVDTLGLLPARRILLVGLGSVDQVTTASLRVFAAIAGRAANDAKACSLHVVVPGVVDVNSARAIAEGIVLGTYRFTKYLTGDRIPKANVERAVVHAKGKLDAIRKAVDIGFRVGMCVCNARDLVNEPGNELTPIALAVYAEQMAQRCKLSCRTFLSHDLEQMGMKLLLAVAQGSANGPCLIHLTYAPVDQSVDERADARGDVPPIVPSRKKLVIVGKGLTFDSGGLCAKPAAGMGEMKSDMAGAANVLGFMEAVAVLAPRVEVHGIIGAAENMPDGNAFRPGDIVRSLDGKTVEIVNTDAEGRLVLADALAYARDLDPTVLLCNATLTGACVVALGQRCSAFYATREDLAVQFAEAARDSGEQFWQLPLLDDMKERLKSDVADLKHTGDRWGGSVTAAVFLKEFVGNVPFVHGDIAGPAFSDKAYGLHPKGGTGHGILAFLRFLEGL